MTSTTPTHGRGSVPATVLRPGIDVCPRYADADPQGAWQYPPRCYGWGCPFCGVKCFYWLARAVEMALPNQELGLGARGTVRSDDDIARFRVHIGRALREVVRRRYGPGWAFCIEREGDYLYAPAVIRGRHVSALVLRAVALEQGLGNTEILSPASTAWESAQYLLRSPLRASRERSPERREEILLTHHRLNRRAVWASPSFWLDPAGRRLPGVEEAVKAAKQGWWESKKGPDGRDR
jgi:hypothetical protein